MATLIAAYNSEGCYGRCDAKCHDATSDVCHCICGGANHGVGIKKAIANTEEMAKNWILEYEEQHDMKFEWDVLPKPIQLELF